MGPMTLRKMSDSRYILKKGRNERGGRGKRGKKEEEKKEEKEAAKTVYTKFIFERENKKMFDSFLVLQRTELGMLLNTYVFNK